jgi:hypothetical protein
MIAPGPAKMTRPSATFEQHELDVNRPPRAVDRPILTGFGIWRVIFVGLALLAVTL